MFKMIKSAGSAKHSKHVRHKWLECSRHTGFSRVLIVPMLAVLSIHFHPNMFNFGQSRPTLANFDQVHPTHNQIWPMLTPFGQISRTHGQNWPTLAKFGPIWPNLTNVIQNWPDLAKFGQSSFKNRHDWPRLAKLDQSSSKKGQVWSNLARNVQFWPNWANLTENLPSLDQFGKLGGGGMQPGPNPKLHWKSSRSHYTYIWPLRGGGDKAMGGAILPLASVLRAGGIPASMFKATPHTITCMI